MSPVEKLSAKDKFDYVMKHFALISDQRVKTFNFYVIASAAAVSASVAVAARADITQNAIRIIGGAHVFIAIVFWLIDVRGCRILAISAEALAALEKAHLNGLSEQLINEDARRNKEGAWGFISYRMCFLMIFLVHAAFGLLFAFHSEWLISGAH